MKSVVEELETIKDRYDHSCLDNAYQRGVKAGAQWLKKKAIEIVKNTGVSDDVCEWKVKSNYYVTECSHDTDVMYGLKQDFKFCPYCSKKIKVVE